MARVSKSPKPRLDKSLHVSKQDALDELVRRLVEKGAARLMYFGTFRVIEYPAHKRFDFVDRKMVKTKARKGVRFTAAQNLLDVLNPAKRKRSG